jgi:AraC-like DNA-binding protein
MTSGISSLRQKLERGQRFSRHRHPHPYAAVVLAGAYREAGSGGRFRVSSGEVMFHEAFDAHLNCVEPTGAVILNIPLQSCATQRAHCGVANVDKIAAIAERDPAAAETELLNSLLELPARAGDWPDMLAADLLCNAVTSLEIWSAQHGLTPHSLSRGFRNAFGVTPKRFGLESKAHTALRHIRVGAAPLSAIAADAGFSDQSHMTRTIAELTGNPPSHWAPDKSVQVPLTVFR